MKSLSDVEKFDLLDQDEVDALPEGTLIVVRWGGWTDDMWGEYHVYRGMVSLHKGHPIACTHWEYQMAQERWDSDKILDKVGSENWQTQVRRLPGDQESRVPRHGLRPPQKELARV